MMWTGDQHVDWSLDDGIGSVIPATLSLAVCGFGMGATPNALSNMQAVTFRRPPSYTAFLVIPIMGGMFLDIINSFTVLLFLNLI